MSTKKKKNKKKKLGSLILLLFLTVIMLATSTYAWFTANRTVKISDINVNVAASTGLQISTDALSWKSVISNADITTGYSVISGDNNATDINQLPSVLVPVSTVGGVISGTGKLDMYKGTVVSNETTGNLELTAVEDNNETKGTTGDYVAFDIFLKLDQAANVYLEKGSGVKASTTDASKGLQYAARYAFVTEGNGAATDPQYNLVSLKGATASNVKIVEPNFDGHTAYGVTQASLYYRDYSNWDGITAQTENNTIVSYDGVKTTIPEGILLENTNYTDTPSKFQTVTTIPRSVAFGEGRNEDGNYLLFENMSAGVTKIRVYFWIEGQDVDCENNASGSNLIFNLSLTLNDGLTPTV